jgi:ribosomal protein S6
MEQVKASYAERVLTCHDGEIAELRRKAQICDDILEQLALNVEDLTDGG